MGSIVSGMTNNMNEATALWSFTFHTESHKKSYLTIHRYDKETVASSSS